MGEPDGVDDGSRLCLACGLCCNGAVFAYVPLDVPGEAERLRTRLPVIQEADEPHPNFLLPCPAHGGASGCTLYGDRPDACSAYACRQLKAVRSGARSLAEALAAVAEIKALFERVDAELPAGGWIWHRARALREAAAPAALDERRRRSALLLDLTLLELRIDRDVEAREEPAAGAAPGPGEPGSAPV